MFQKLVTNLPFSPALVSQLGFYASRLRREEATRRLGLVLTALALVVQSFAVIVPPQAANAASSNDMIRGGTKNKTEILAAYDASARGNGDFEDILSYAGITRAELAAAKVGKIDSGEHGKGSSAWKSFGRNHRFSSSQGEVKHIIPTSTSSSVTVYSRPMFLYDGNSNYAPSGIKGNSAKAGDFAIIFNCGNLVLTKLPKPAPKASFISATCDVVTGRAIDYRNTSQAVKVYLYLGKSQADSTRVGPITTSSSGNFSYSVPASYKSKATPTNVYGVMVPLAGWNESTVRFTNSVVIPGNCTPAPKPAASCDQLQFRQIDRTRVSFIASASTDNGATISQYRFAVKSGASTLTEKVVASTSKTADSGVVQITSPGSYTGSVEVTTSVGKKSSSNCQVPFTISPADKCEYNPDITVEDKDCAPCPENSQIWVKSDDCREKTVLSKSASNLTQDKDAESATANASDRIEYTVTVENIGVVPATARFDEDLVDVLEYSTLQDNGGGSFNAESNVLTWGEVRLAAGETQSRTFVVALKESIPLTSQGSSDPASYDCRMINTFGNNVTIDVNCEAPKQVEEVVSELPSTGPGANIMFAGGLASIASYFWARSRQLGREVKLVRKEFNSGSL